jgi:5-methylcytosine-specific restriction enzyme A
MPAIAINPQSQPWRTWYSLQRWRARAKHQLSIEPLCALCLAQNRITPATIADHHPPHKGDWNKFRLGPLQSLCHDCHKGKWASDRHGYSSAIGDDGFPIDPRHPFNVADRPGTRTCEASSSPRKTRKQGAGENTFDAQLIDGPSPKRNA